MYIIVAFDFNGSIGKQGCIPWSIPEDLQHFKHITSTVSSPDKMNAVIMGRKTWESLPKKPLEGRVNIIVSTTLKYVPGAHVCPNFKEAVAYVERLKRIVDKTFVIGGSSIYRSALLHEATRDIYVTVVHDIFPGCDTRFPIKILSDFWKEDGSQYSGVLVSMKSGHQFSHHLYKKIV
jgi:dihydrofolate reductase